MQKKNKLGNMNFKCEQLTITDDPDFGCTINFSDSEKIINEFTSVSELLHPKNKYLMIQRSYPEESGDMDWYSVETSESEIGLNYKDNMYIKLQPDLFEINWSGEQLLIGLSLSDGKYLELEKMLKIRFKKRVTLL